MSSNDKSQTTKLGPAAQKIADGLNDAIDGRYHTTAERDWIPVCNSHGGILYWIATDGERRTETPPRAEWSPEMDGYEIGQ